MGFDVGLEPIIGGNVQKGHAVTASDNIDITTFAHLHYDENFTPDRNAGSGRDIVYKCDQIKLRSSVWM